MYKIIGADGKEYGPVPVDRVRDWMAGGRANAQTRIRRDGENEWTTIGALPEFADQVAAASAPPPPPAAAPTEAAPAAAAAPDTRDARTIADDLINHAPLIDVFGCLGRSFDLWKSNFLPIVGATFIVMIILGAMSFIPVLGAIAGMLLTGVFYGGLYYYYLGLMRGEPREISDVFAGFQRALGPLILAGLFITLLTFAVVLVFLGPWLGAIFYFARDGQPSPALLAGLFLFMLPAIYLGIAWSFTFPLVIDKGLPAWTAMEVSRRVVTRQWFRVFFVTLLGALLSMLGLIALFIGIFFTMPLVFGSVLYAYEDLCNPPRR